jgi:hypothetical protein
MSEYRRLWTGVAVIGLVPIVIFSGQWLTVQTEKPQIEVVFPHPPPPEFGATVQSFEELTPTTTDARGRSSLAKEDTALFFVLTISNTGAPSVVANWRLEVRLQGQGAPIFPELVYIRNPIKLKRQTSIQTYIPEDALYNKTQEQPIPTNGQQTGFLVFLLKGIPANSDAFTGAVMTVSFTDIKKRTYSADYARRKDQRRDTAYVRLWT